MTKELFASSKGLLRMMIDPRLKSFAIRLKLAPGSHDGIYLTVQPERAVLVERNHYTGANTAYGKEALRLGKIRASPIDSCAPSPFRTRLKMDRPWHESQFRT